MNILELSSKLGESSGLSSEATQWRTKRLNEGLEKQYAQSVPPECNIIEVVVIALFPYEAGTFWR